jgi:hypothetical protein
MMKALNVQGNGAKPDPAWKWKPSEAYPTYRSYVRFNVAITVLQFYWQGANVEGITGILYVYKPYTEALRAVGDLERLERLIPRARVLFSEANILYRG